MTRAERPDGISQIALTDPEGNRTTLGSFAADPLAVVLVRYFGCLPCQHFLRDVDRAIEDFPAGSRVIAVGGSSIRQAQWLRDVKGVTLPLLLDPGQEVRSIAGVGQLTARQMSKGDGWRSYAKAMRSGFRPQVPTSDALQAPGIVILGSDFSVAWVHEGEMMGDYPTVPDFIGHMQTLATAG